MKEVAKLLITPYAQHRFESTQTTKKIKFFIEIFVTIKCSNETVEEPRVSTTKKICSIYSRSADQKTKTICTNVIFTFVITILLLIVLTVYVTEWCLDTTCIW